MKKPIFIFIVLVAVSAVFVSAMVKTVGVQKTESDEKSSISIVFKKHQPDVVWNYKESGSQFGGSATEFYFKADPKAIHDAIEKAGFIPDPKIERHLREQGMDLREWISGIDRSKIKVFKRPDLLIEGEKTCVLLTGPDESWVYIIPVDPATI